MCPFTRALPRPAFTILELLVVIAIIALLTSILLPALASTRDAARASVCSSNLRQFAIALDLYADDHADRYAPASSDALSNLNRWHGTRPTASAPFTPERGPITPYIHADPREDALRACPTFLGVLDTLRHAGIGFERGCGGYGYNAAFVGVERGPERFVPPPAGSSAPPRGVSSVRTDRSGSPRSRFQSPAATAAFADAAFADQSPAGDIIEYSFLEPRFHPHLASPSRLDPSTHFRHPPRARAGRAASSGRASIAWLDGRVSPEALSLSWSSGLYLPDPSERDLGWTGPTDDNALYDFR